MGNEDSSTSQPPSPDTREDTTSSSSSSSDETYLHTKSQVSLLKSHHQNLTDLIKLMKTQECKEKIPIPEFNPDKSDIDPRTWCDLIDIYMAERNLRGSTLFMVISTALKGSALRWLSQLSHEDMTWPDFKKMFKTRYCFETPAAVVINFRNSRPTEDESLPAYATHLATGLMSSLHGLTTEQIIIAMVLSQVSKFDTRLQRLAFTTDMSTLAKMQRELQAYSFLKRKASSIDGRTHNKQRKSNYSIKCFNCGKFGHRASNCRFRRYARQTAAYNRSMPGTATTGNRENIRNVTCFKCGSNVQNAVACPQNAGPSGNQGTTSGGVGAAVSAASQRWFDACFMNNSQEELLNYSLTQEDEAD
ncbi:uncharacterized protein LOC124543272 [Vanessa cardui]|uniref:uncharacterized protein LOC124543272 n=1 Tax=Vanessa cardui TaxID=171605 RepID=UPI001F130BF1|nr:uncharacterized protein LOC124543272 [Vanessa cardui]